MRRRLGAEHNPAISAPIPSATLHLRTNLRTYLRTETAKFFAKLPQDIIGYTHSGAHYFAPTPDFGSWRKAIGHSLLERPIILRLFGGIGPQLKLEIIDTPALSPLFRYLRENE